MLGRFHYSNCCFQEDISGTRNGSAALFTCYRPTPLRAILLPSILHHGDQKSSSHPQSVGLLTVVYWTVKRNLQLPPIKD